MAKEAIDRREQQLADVLETLAELQTQIDNMRSQDRILSVDYRIACIRAKALRKHANALREEIRRLKRLAGIKYNGTDWQAFYRAARRLLTPKQFARIENAARKMSE